MNKYIINSLFIGLILIIGVISSCSNSNKSEGDLYTKEELKKIFTEYPNERMNEIHVNLDSLMNANFTFEEKEDLIITRMTFFKEDQKLKDVKEIFEEYRKTYGTSFLDESAGNQDEFMEAFIMKKTKGGITQ